MLKKGGSSDDTGECTYIEVHGHPREDIVFTNLYFNNRVFHTAKILRNPLGLNRLERVQKSL